MSDFRVYLTDMENKEKMYKFENKEKIREFVNDANKAGFFGYKIIMTLEGTDILIKRGRFNNKDERLEIPELDDEWRILENGFPQNYTRFMKFKE
ncbi:MAG: hypothetical protein IJK18_09105 [Clostridia bacterium]|nr:hypothetical protein [Clostridia bacterium]